MLTLMLSLWFAASPSRTVAVADATPTAKAIAAWYEKNMAAFEAKDVAAIMALRTDDFHTETPDGKVNTRADMEERTQRFVDRIDAWILQDFKIDRIHVEGDLASTDVHQHTVRMQRYPDGTLHKIDSSVVQRESWKRTPDGWKLYRVDRIRDHELLVDDVRQP